MFTNLTPGEYEHLNNLMRIRRDTGETPDNRRDAQIEYSILFKKASKETQMGQRPDSGKYVRVMKLRM